MITIKNPSYLAVHVADISPLSKPRGAQWWLVLSAMLLVLGAIAWGWL